MTRVALVLLALLCSWLPATAADGDDPGCSAWFPDLQCEREARPEGFVPPVSMPYFFEDPFVTTGVSVHGLWHDFPWDSVFRGGDLWVLAIQARLAVTERLAFIATKDGYAWLRPGSNSEIRPEQGFFDLLAGFKYVLVEHEASGFVLTPAVRFSLPVGQSDVFSGKGRGAIVPSASAALPLGPVNAIGSFGAFQPFDTSKASAYVFYNLHLSTPVLGAVIPFAELSGTTWTRSGSGRNEVDTRSFGTVDLDAAQAVLDGAGVTDERSFEGADAVNLGSSRVAGNTIVTVALGARVPVTKRASLAGYWEIPVTERKDIWEQRVGINAVVEF